MSTELKASSIKVQDFLSSRGHDFVIQQMPASTRTAVEAADAIGCGVAQIAKSLIFKNGQTGEAVLIVASGTNMVCADKIEQQTGIPLEKSQCGICAREGWLCYWRCASRRSHRKSSNPARSGFEAIR
ncbi:YbaK/prolyl-tRNA synthetase associated region [Vibrio tubiashii ATCC 19109]|uniref:YbaK/prolyl-tRNA synthetase associated region n=1 Tax=Vibrio tubiashii ATCC 19109 TaxID=1051646 RepID=A0ABN0D9N4_9VIBR|nr:YbaK/prolyl-tRNA synthetase associated region [Vibrio tubiashii ATCC 19109]